MILAVDVGGTKVGVAFVEERGGALTVQDDARYPSREHSSLGEIVADYLKRHGGATPEAIGVGVAGPVEDGVARITNLTWSVDAAQLSAQTGAPVFLLNDLEAHGYGLGDIGPGHLVTLNAGTERPGNRALIAAGTGLGEAILFWDGAAHRPSASEGGHASFSPTTPDDDALLAFLRERCGGSVSWERVVSGLLGFRNLFDFLVAERGRKPGAALAKAAAADPDLGAAVIAAGTAGDPLADEILRWFARLYGAEAGNLALKALAVGGLYLGGGIAPRILPWLEGGVFVSAMADKGRFGAMLAAIPVRIATDPELPLKGAARRALLGLAAPR